MTNYDADPRSKFLRPPAEEKPAPKAPDWVIQLQRHSAQSVADVPLFSDLTLIGWLIAAAALFNFLILPVIRVLGEANSEAGVVFFVSLALGVYAAELGALTLWLVWGPDTFLWRLTMHSTAAFGLYVAWALGFGAAFATDAPPGGIQQVWGWVLCGLPLISLAAQLPLWPLRIYFGWKVERESTAVKPQPLLIRDFLAGTVVTSVSLAALRLMPEDFQRDPDFGIAWGVGTFATLGISAISLLPAIVFVLRFKETPAAAGAWFGYVAGMWMATLAVVSILGGSGPPEDIVFAMIVAFGSFATAIFGVLFIARLRGYRLWFSRDLRQGATLPPAVPPGAATPPAA